MSKRRSAIKIRTHSDDTLLITLPGHKNEPGVSKRMIRLENLTTYQGPSVNFDFDKDGRLIAIEVLVYESDRIAD